MRHDLTTKNKLDFITRAKLEPMLSTQSTTLGTTATTLLLHGSPRFWSQTWPATTSIKPKLLIFGKNYNHEMPQPTHLYDMNSNENSPNVARRTRASSNIILNRMLNGMSLITIRAKHITASLAKQTPKKTNSSHS